MNILALDTATESCSASLLCNDEEFHLGKIAPRQHTELILPMIDELLSEAGISKKEIDLLAFGRGPGAFTGVRIGIGIIQGLAYALNKPVVAVSSLRILAQAYAKEHEYIVATFDARMGEVYWGCFQTRDGIVHSLDDEQVITPDSTELPANGKFLAVGTGFSAYADKLCKRFENRLTDSFSDVFPSARDLLKLAVYEYDAGNILQADELMPVYLRNKVV